MRAVWRRLAFAEAQRLFFFQSRGQDFAVIVIALRACVAGCVSRRVASCSSEANP